MPEIREERDDVRFMMPGKIYDVVRHHENIPFRRVRHMIQKSKVKVIESSANVFRRCFQPLADSEAHKILQQAYDNTRKDRLKLTYLSKINNEDTLVELECFYEAIVKKLGDGQTSLQGFNLAVNPASLLKTIPYHTSPKLNPRLEAKNGINVPIFRLGSRDSLEEMHKTLGLLDRADVLHWGGCRLWLVVQLHFQRALELRLAGQLTRRGGYPPWCPMPTYHKQFALTPSLLRKWLIPFEIVVQMPGDLVHLRDWVPHQVLDLGTNLSETVSVGSAEWNMSADSSALLNCPCGTKSNVGDNNFGGNGSIFARVELMLPRSRPMPCTHVPRAVEAAKKEYEHYDDPGCNQQLPMDHDRVPVIKEYRRTSPSSPAAGDKCFGCGKRSEDLKSHLSRHIMCRAKLNLATEHCDVEEPATDESDDELECDEVTQPTNYDARYHCAYCRQPFELRRLINGHVEKTHRMRIAKRNADDPGPILKRQKTKEL